MSGAVEDILHPAPGTPRQEILERVAALADERQLADLVTGYNWDDGFDVPLAIVRHPRCDRGLALRLFWDVDDGVGQAFARGGEAELTSEFSTTARYDAAGFGVLVSYAEALVSGLRAGHFTVGHNAFDTGFFGDDPSLTDRQRTLREVRTTRALREWDEALLRPEPGR